MISPSSLNWQLRLAEMLGSRGEAALAVVSMGCSQDWRDTSGTTGTAFAAMGADLAQVPGNKGI